MLLSLGFQVICADIHLFFGLCLVHKVKVGRFVLYLQRSRTSSEKGGLFPQTQHHMSQVITVRLARTQGTEHLWPQAEVAKPRPESP